MSWAASAASASSAATTDAGGRRTPRISRPVGRRSTACAGPPGTLALARPEIDGFNAGLRALLGAGGFTDTAAALHRLAYGEP